MTTLVALASKHAVVVGTDSLGTESRPMVSPARLIERYFESADGKLKMSSDGEPVLKDFSLLMDESESVPYNQLLHVTKLFKLRDLPIAVAFTGATSIGQLTIRQLTTSFCASDRATKVKRPTNYTVRSIADRLRTFLTRHYEAAYPETYQQRELQLLVGGYDRNQQFPTVCRIDVRRNELKVTFPAVQFGIAFAGQMDWIQRIVFGTDTWNKGRLMTRSAALLDRYRQKIVAELESAGNKVEVPMPETYREELQLLDDDWDLDGLDADWAEFSEQNAVDCVDFFLNIMIRAQGVSQQMPTVGGNVHIAVIRKDGYHPVTKEVWRHGEHEVAIPEVGT